MFLGFIFFKEKIELSIFVANLLCFMQPIKMEKLVIQFFSMV